MLMQWILSKHDLINGSRVLIVDDDSASIQILKTCLTTAGCHLKIVESGEAAVAEMISNTYDLVFLDWCLPDLNGSETLQKVEKINSMSPTRDFQWTSFKMPVVTYSSLDRQQIHLPNSRHFRFVDHWTKTTPFQKLSKNTDRILTEIEGNIADLRL